MEVKNKEMSYDYKKIKLSDIVLYEENPRFEKASSEIEALQKIIEDQGVKLVKLAEHIIDYGFNPIDIPAVIKKTKKFFMKEGNRRIACLMLVDNPNLVFSNDVLKNKFLLLKSQKGHLLPKEIFCAVFKNQSDADEWIRLKHAVHHEGVGIERWDSKQANRFAKGNIEDLPIELQAIDLLKQNKKTSQSTINLITTLKASNLRRLLSDPYIKSKIGLEDKDNKLQLVDSKIKSLKNLESVVQEISKPVFVVNNIYHKGDRKDFINSIKLKKVKIIKANLLNTIKKEKKEDKGKTFAYTSLIDPNKRLPTGANSKICNIYRELQKISADIAPHAVALLLRVLIEISVKSYLKKKKIEIDQNDFAIVNIFGETIKLDSLKKKINYIATNYIIDADLKKSVTLLNKNSFNTTLNQIVHNEIHQSTPTSVRDFWINAENLFDFLVS